MIQREILHVDMDAFFVSVEEVRDPSLRGKPVVVGPGGEPPQSRGPTLYGGPGLNADNARTHLPPGGARGVVAAASYEARKYGIHSAMPVARARRLCPRAIFLPGSYRLYAEFSERIFALLETYSPLVEPMSLDEAFVDLTGCGKLHGPVLQTAERIRNEIKTTLGINASIGIASNKLLAKIASACAKPSGMLWIPLGGEQRFLAPLAVDRIPGVGPKSGEQFKRMGIRTVGSLAALPRDLLEEVHGKWGAALFLKSRGICNSPVRGRGEGTNRSVSRETTLETDSLDARFLESTLSYLVEKAAAQLRESGLHAQSVTLKLRYSDFKTVTRTRMLREPTSGDHFIFQAVAPLLGKLLIRRTRVRLVGVSLSSLTATPYSQTDLFQNVGREQWDRLYRGIDRIRKKHGFRSILRGKSAENL